MNITLVMSSSITTTLIMGAGLAVGAAVADGELGSVMGSMLLNVHVPTTHTTSQSNLMRRVQIWVKLVDQAPTFRHES